jgi:hypothetical protein
VLGYSVEGIEVRVEVEELGSAVMGADVGATVAGPSELGEVVGALVSPGIAEALEGD